MGLGSSGYSKVLQHCMMGRLILVRHHILCDDFYHSYPLRRRLARHLWEHRLSESGNLICTAEVPRLGIHRESYLHRVGYQSLSVSI